MLFLQSGDYESVKIILEQSEHLVEEERIFMQALLASDPRSPYFSSDTVNIYADTLKNLFPESRYMPQVSVLEALMSEYEGSKLQVNALTQKVSEMSGALASKDGENQELLDEYIRVNEELKKQNQRLVQEDRKLRKELESIRLRMEALKEIDMQLKRSTDGQ